MTRAEIEQMQDKCKLLFRLGKWERAKRLRAKLEPLIQEQLKQETLVETIRRDLELIGQSVSRGA
jgi:hypothetical protein